MDTTVDGVSQSVAPTRRDVDAVPPPFQKVSHDNPFCCTKILIPITNGGSNRIMNLGGLTVHIGPLLTESLWYLMLSGSDVLNIFINEEKYNEDVKTVIVCIYGRVLTITASGPAQYDSLLDFMLDFSRGVGVASLDYMSSHTNTQIHLSTTRDEGKGSDLRSPFPSGVLFPFGHERTSKLISEVSGVSNSDRWTSANGKSVLKELMRFWGHASLAIPSFRGMLNNSSFSMYFDRDLEVFTSSAGGDVLSGGTAIFGPVYNR
jgi:hypothetical protein